MAPISALWRRLDEPHGLVHGALSEMPPGPEHPSGGFLLDGAAIGADSPDDTGPVLVPGPNPGDGTPAREAPPARPWSVRFSVIVDHRWATRTAYVEVLSADGLDRVTLAVDDLGRWTLDGRVWPDLQGCTDLDISVTPLTNTLPVRRLGLAVGQAADVDVAWLDVPSLAVHRVRQTYRREPDGPDGHRYLYVDPTYGTFGFTVDPHGLVRQYQGLFTRVG